MADGTIYVAALVLFICGLLGYIVAKWRGASTNAAIGWFLLGCVVGLLSPLGALFFAKPKTPKSPVP